MNKEKSVPNKNESGQVPEMGKGNADISKETQRDPQDPTKASLLGTAWVFGSAQVSDNAPLLGNTSAFIRPISKWMEKDLKKNLRKRSKSPLEWLKLAETYKLPPSEIRELAESESANILGNTPVLIRRTPKWMEKELKEELRKGSKSPLEWLELEEACGQYFPEIRKLVEQENANRIRRE